MNAIKLTLTVLVACVVVGAGSTVWAQAPPPEPAPPPPIPALKYQFGVNDTVEFKFPYVPELDFSAPVRPDGAIFFPHLGDIQVVGLTVTALSDALRARYASVLKDPELTITVRQFPSPRIFVAGEVLAPGRFDYRTGMTLGQALFAAGGYKETATQRVALLLRAESPGMLRVTAVRVQNRKIGSVPDLALAPDDIVIVPKSRIARLDQMIRQYSRDLLPVSNLGFFFNLFGATNTNIGVTPGAQ